MDDHDDEQGGQVSDVSGMDPAEADTPIQPDQSTDGAPDSESGGVQRNSQSGPGGKPDHVVTKKDTAPGQESPSDHPGD